MSVPSIRLPTDPTTLAFLGRIPFFASLPPVRLAELAAQSVSQAVPTQTVLFRQGDNGDTLYVILNGEIEITQMLDGAPLLLSTLHTGEYFGEMAILENAPRSATARAVRDTEYLEIHKDKLFELAREYPRLFTDAARVLSARLRDTNFGRVSDLIRKNRELEESNRLLRANYDATLHALSSALDLRDQVTQGHAQRVTAYTLLIADALGVPADRREPLRLGALLHDIGKIGVPDAILRKPGTLTTDEWFEMKKHPEMGAAIIDRIEFLQNARSIVIAHHEKFDGSGYPFQLSGKAIPLEARIFAIADVFDALTTFRPYRIPMSNTEAAAFIKSAAGSHFDPVCVAAFERALPRMIEVMRNSFEE